MQSRYPDIINIFCEYCSRHSQLVIYGAGDAGQMVADFMEQENIPFMYFCVSSMPEKNMVHNHEIKEIREVIHSNADVGIIVAVSRKSVNDMLHLLKDLGSSYFYSAEFLSCLFQRKCRESALKVQIQEDYICKVSTITFDKNTYYICCPASIGDTLYVAALVRDYKKENPFIQKVCLILKKGHTELGKMFPAIDEILVSDELVQTLDEYSMYTQTWKLKNYLYGHFKKSIHFEYDQEYIKYNAILSRYRRLIMDLPETAELESINLSKDSNTDKNQEQCVVIMPWAKTAGLLPDSFWEELVERLRNTGHVVYTNVGSEKERVIKGTEGMKKPLLETALFCEKCRAVISLRSGLCDLLGFTTTKLIVINTSEELSEEWNLNDVFRRDEICNVDCFEDCDYDEKLDKIMKMIG